VIDDCQGSRRSCLPFVTFTWLLLSTLSRAAVRGSRPCALARSPSTPEPEAESYSCPDLSPGSPETLNHFPYREFGELAGHLRYAERSSRKLARSTFYGISRWQAKTERKQAFLGRIVDIGAELFAIASAVVYANTIASEHSERATEARELADLFSRQARRRVESLFGDLWSNDDTDDYAAGQRVLEGRYRWLEEGIIDPSGEGPMIAAQPEDVQEAGEDRQPPVAAEAS
jgi:hypothetical protein